MHKGIKSHVSVIAPEPLPFKSEHSNASYIGDSTEYLETFEFILYSLLPQDIYGRNFSQFSKIFKPPVDYCYLSSEN